MGYCEGRYDQRIATFTIVPMNRRMRRRRSHSRVKRQARWQTLGSLTPTSSESDWQAFEADLQRLETAVQTLRQRFNQIQTLQHQQQALQQRLQTADLPADEIQQLQRQLDDLESQLDSALLDWRSLQEPFWQAVRFGGIGIILGWILHAIAN